MYRQIPVWFLLLCFLAWGIFTVIFGWSVKSSVSRDGGGSSGAFGRIAVKISNFPTQAKLVFKELSSISTGDYVDSSIRTNREENSDYSDFSPFDIDSGADIIGPIFKADRTKMFNAWRFLVGAFTINGQVENAALLISPDLKITQHWILDEIPLGDLEPREKYKKFIHGVEILADGSVIFTFDGSVSLQRFDSCAKRIWATEGKYHHSVHLDETGKFVWTLLNKYIDDGTGESANDDGSGEIGKLVRYLAQVSVADGSVNKLIDLEDVIVANPMIDILEIRRIHKTSLGKNTRNTTGEWIPDAHHMNDIEPLSSELAGQFDCCSAGDLLISARSLNLIFVIDPNTLKIKWWRSGSVQRQHDPDWLPNGKISVFNNRMSRDFSEIALIDPHTYQRETFFDGRKNDFYSRIRGKHQFIDNETLVVTSPQQGRAFEVDKNGDIVFEIFNVKPNSNDTNYVISELKYLPLNFFNEGAFQCN